MQCINHPQRPAEWTCPACHASYCNDCADLKMYGYVKVEICPRCKEKLVRVAEYQAPLPFWTRLPEIFRYPFEGDGWVRIIAVGAVAVVLQGLAFLGIMLGGIFGFLVSLSLFTIYFGIVISYFYLVISASETGKLHPPQWSSFSSISDFSRPVNQFILTCLVVFMPLMIFLFILLGISGFDFGQTLHWMKNPIIIILLILLGLTGLVILPMGLLLLGVFGTAKLAWNPVIIFGQIMKIPREYLALLGFLILFMIFALIIYIILSFIFLALGGGFISIIIQLFLNNAVDFYFLVVFGHILGYTAYQCQYELGWWKETREFKEAVSGPETTVHPNLEEGLALLSQGALNRAADLLDVVLKDEPKNRKALQGMLTIYCMEKKESEAAELGKQLIAYLIQDKDQKVATESYLELVAAFPKFALPVRDQILMAKWLQSQNNFFEAAAAYRQYAVAYPDDRMAAKALYQCGDLLWKKCNQAEKARHMFEYILKRYPESELATYVRQALDQIQPTTAS